MARPQRVHQKFSFGDRIPWAVGLLLALTVSSSLVVAFTSRHAAPLFELAALVPGQVWRGEVWRLLTWPLIQPSAIGLIFTCLIYFWFGPDLAEEWGSRRFLSVFGGVALAAAVGTCVVAQLDPPIMAQTYLGSWALGTALVVAWGLTFPWRTIRIYFILPVQAYWFAWLTVAGTAVFAIYQGWEQYLPELFAEGATLAWLYRKRLGLRWPEKRPARSGKGPRSRPMRKPLENVAYLRVVESDTSEPPPMSQDLQAQVRTALSGQKKHDAE
jgi:membrane associated rhomboid family serine protease